MPQYCLDTSTLIEAWVRLYPEDIFPTLWIRLEEMAYDGSIICPDEVLREIAKKEDDLYKWAKARDGLFYPLDGGLQVKVTEILKQFPRLVDSAKSRHEADPFVIGLAKMTGRTVVTQEGMSGKLDKPKIPDVCKHYGMRWINILELIRENNWNFQ